VYILHSAQISGADNYLDITKKWDTTKSALHSFEAGPRCNCTLVVTTLHSLIILSHPDW